MWSGLNLLLGARDRLILYGSQHIENPLTIDSHCFSNEDARLLRRNCKIVTFTNVRKEYLLGHDLLGAPSPLPHFQWNFPFLTFISLFLGSLIQQGLVRGEFVPAH